MDGRGQQHGRPGYLCDRTIPDGAAGDRVGAALRRLLFVDGDQGTIEKLPALLLFREALRVWEGTDVRMVLQQGNEQDFWRKTDLLGRHRARFPGLPRPSRRWDCVAHPELLVADSDFRRSLGGPRLGRHRSGERADRLQVLQAA